MDLHWGLISTAKITHRLINALSKSTRSKLLAVASRDGYRAQKFAKENNIPKAYDSYHALLDDPEVNIVYNALPNNLHAEWTIKAIEAGKHVLCEKPIVTSLADLDTIEKLAKKNKVIVYEGLKHLYHPQIIKVREMLNSGLLGDLQVINSSFGFYLPPEDRDNIRLNPNLCGGALWDVGVYPSSLVIMFAQSGSPSDVFAKQIIGKTGVDITMTGQMMFRNGILAQISCGFSYPFRYQVTQIVGSNGFIQINDLSIPQRQESTMTIATKKGSEKIEMDDCDLYLKEIECMESCIIDGSEPIVSLEFSRDYLRSILAMYESATYGKVIHIS